MRLATRTRRLPVGLLLLALALAPRPASASPDAVDGVWVPPPPPPPSPPLGPPQPLSAMRRVGFGHLAWTKSFQTATLALHLGHFIAEASGTDGSRLLLPETILLWGHVASNITGPWGYAMALDDGRPPTRHRGLGIGLLEQGLYSALVATLTVGSRALFFRNGCHLPDARGCIDSYYTRVSTPQTVIWYASAGAMLALSALHLAAAAQLTRLEREGLLDGPAGEPYRRLAPQAALLPWGGPGGGGLTLAVVF